MKRVIPILLTGMLAGLCEVQADGDYYWNPGQLTGSGNVSLMGGDGVWSDDALSFWNERHASLMVGTSFGNETPDTSADFHVHFNRPCSISKKGIASFYGSETSGVHISYYMRFPGGTSDITSIPSNGRAGINTGNASGYFVLQPGTVLNLNASGPGPMTLVSGRDVSTSGGIVFQGAGTVNMNNNVWIVPSNGNSRTVAEEGVIVNFNAGSAIYGVNGSRERPLSEHMSRFAVNNATVNVRGGDLYLGYRGGTASLDRSWGLGIGMTVDSGVSTVNIFSGNVTALGDTRLGNTTRNAGVTFGGHTDAASGGTLNLVGGNLFASNIRANRNVTAILNLNGGSLFVSMDEISKETPLSHTEMQMRLDEFIFGFNGNATNRVILGERGVRVDTSGIDVTKTDGVATIAAAIHDDGSAGTLTKCGINSLRLSAANTYRGDTIIEAGTLLVSGSLNGTTRVGGSAELSGNGSLKDIVLEADSRLSPRHGMRGTSLIWDSSAELYFDLDQVYSGSTILSLSELQISGSGPLRVRLGNANPSLESVTLISVSGSSGLAGASVEIEGGQGWSWDLSSDGRQLVLLNGKANSSSWINSGGSSLFSDASNWSPVGVPIDGAALVMNSAGLLLFDESRRYDAVGLTVDSGILAGTTASDSINTVLVIGKGGLSNHGLGIDFGNLCVVTELPQIWRLGGGTLTLGKVVPKDLLTIEVEPGVVIFFNEVVTDGWPGQINIVGNNPAIMLGHENVLDESHIARILINGRSVKRVGNTLVVDSGAENEVEPLLYYTFDEGAGVYPSHGSIKASLYAHGGNQGAGAGGSGVSGEDADVAWDASANSQQGFGSDSMLRHGANLPIFEGLSAFTLTFWYYADQAFDPLRTTLVHKKDANGGFALSTLRDQDYGNAFSLSLGDFVMRSDYFCAPGGIGKTRHWLFAAIVWNGETASLYYGDKVYPVLKVGEEEFSGPLGCSATPLVIGNIPNGSTPFDGKIDNLRFYDRALGVDDIEEIRSEEAGPYVSEGFPVREIARELTVLAETDGREGLYAPFLLKTSGGRLLLSHSVSAANRKSLSGVTVISIFDYEKSSWSTLSRLSLIHSRMFEVEGSLYLVGHHESGLYISKSSDEGGTWSDPVLIGGDYAWLPGAANVWVDSDYVYFSADRRVVRTASEGGFLLPDIAPVLFRAPCFSDLTKSSSWIQASELAFRDLVPGVTAAQARKEFIGLPFFQHPMAREKRPYHEQRAQNPMGWQQAHVLRIDDPDHYWDDPEKRTTHLFMQAQTGSGNYAAFLKVVDNGAGALETMVETLPSEEEIFFLPMPGGGGHFWVVQDPRTKLYWLLALQQESSDIAKKRVLYFSRNLVDWCFAGLLRKNDMLMSEASMCIDGENLWVMELHTTTNQGQEIIAYRIRDFRNLVY